MTIHEFTDQFGNVRRCGTIPRPVRIPVSTSYAENNETWTDDQIREVLAARETTRREIMRESGFLDVFTRKADQHSTSACNGWMDANLYTWGQWFDSPPDPNGTVYSGAYNYSHMNGGRDQGSVLEDGFKLSTVKGHVSVDRCPWDKIYRNETRQFDAEAAKNLAREPVPAGTWQGFKTGMAKGYFGGTAIQAGANIMRAGRDIPGVDRGPGNHAVAVLEMVLLDDGSVGYVTYLDWGPQPGDGGFVTLTDEHFRQTFGVHMFFLMPVGQSGTEGDQ